MTLTDAELPELAARWCSSAQTLQSETDRLARYADESQP
jgi:hypothetical protein